MVYSTFHRLIHLNQTMDAALARIGITQVRATTRLDDGGLITRRVYSRNAWITTACGIP